MATYEYEDARGERRIFEFPFGEAPRAFEDYDGEWSRVYGCAMTFRYGREQFHGQTIRERQKKMESDFKAEWGYDAVPVGHRTYAGTI